MLDRNDVVWSLNDACYRGDVFDEQVVEIYMNDEVSCGVRIPVSYHYHPFSSYHREWRMISQQDYSLDSCYHPA